MISSSPPEHVWPVLNKRHDRRGASGWDERRAGRGVRLVGLHVTLVIAAGAPAGAGVVMAELPLEESRTARPDAAPLS